MTNLCRGCGVELERDEEFLCAECEFNEANQNYAELDHDDTVHFCPDCERPNQFGELCEGCRRERDIDDAEVMGDLSPQNPRGGE